MILKYARQHLIRPARCAMKNAFAYFRRELHYLELHLTDHCNLNCRGCLHYAPLASPTFADPGQYETDLRRLASLFRRINVFRLLGGEPLLHPHVDTFITLTRTYFPESKITVVTNGILLPQAPDRFWDACRTTRTSITLTLYPPFHAHVAAWQDLCDKQGVPLLVRKNSGFYAHHNLKGDSDVNRSFQACRRIFFCPFLRNGRIFTCYLPPLTHLFNESFGSGIETIDGIDIHSPRVTGRTILRYLVKPIATCRWCSEEPSYFIWGTSSRTPPEWDACTPKDRQNRGAGHNSSA